jgi:hypothetical protein
MRPGIIVASTTLIVAVIAATASTRDAQAHQHVANGGFESGLSGWIVGPGAAAGISTDAPAQGAASARLTAGISGARLEYPLPGALSDGAYQVSAQVRGASPATMRISVQPSGQSRLTVAEADVTSAWTAISGAFTLHEAAHTTLVIAVEAAPGAGVFIDDVRIDGAPPVTFTPTATLPASPPTPGLASTGQTATAIASGTPLSTPTIAPLVDVIAPSLRNASFEDVDTAGLPFAWEKYGGTLASDNHARSGARAARLDSGTSSTKWVHQAVSVSSGEWYAFEAWILHNDPATASAFLRISWYASNDAIGAAIDTVDSTTRLDAPSSGYRHLTTDAVRAPGDARSARVRIMLAPRSDAAASILVDDAWFGAVPPPPPPSPTPVPAEPSAASDEPSTSAAAGRAAASSRSSRGSRALSDAPALLLDTASANGSGMVINEVLYDADTPDVPDPDAEWVEIYNATDAPVDLAGWTLRDAVGVDFLPSVVVPARGFAIIAASDAFRAAHQGLAAPIAVLDGRIGNALGNDGDRLLLVDPGGVLFDAVSWGDDAFAFDPSVEDVPEGHSIEREFAGVDSNTAGDFIDNERPSPGLPFASATDPKQQNSGSVRVIEGAPASAFAWLPWAIAIASGAVCAATLGWRTMENLRRTRQP